MHADSFFAIGKAHKVCQDYAEVSSDSRGNLLAALSDGCSSSPHTDFGARCLVLAAMEQHRFLPTKEIEAHLALRTALAVLSYLYLMSESLDATLLLAQMRGGKLRITAFGDGVVVVVFKDGTWRSWSISFSGDAPAYLSYLSNGVLGRRLQEYAEHYGHRTITLTESYGESSETTERIFLPGGLPSYEAYAQALGKVLYEADAAQVQRVFLCSDGVRSFRRPTAAPGIYDPVPLDEVLVQIMAIRSPAGEFMVRRMRRFLGDFCPKNGWVHDDDVAVAAIIADDENKDP
jgi:hypothetical protein